MMFILNSQAFLSGEAVFVLVGIASLLVIYLALCAVKKYLIKNKTEWVEPISNEEDGEETVAAITAAIALILEDEARQERREPAHFRVVSFKRTNNRRVGE